MMLRGRVRGKLEQFMVDAEKIIDNGGVVECMYDNGQLDSATDSILQAFREVVPEKELEELIGFMLTTDSHIRGSIQETTVKRLARAVRDLINAEIDNKKE